MEELKEKAACYAEENVINVLKESFAKVYADGYRDGYRDCKEERIVDLFDDDTKFVDLGLPSGTLWSNDYESEDDDILYIPYCKAESKNIPTIEQWEELMDNCKWEYNIDDSFDLCEARCVGPNGNALRFNRTGKINISSHSDPWKVFFWINGERKGNERNAVNIYNGGKLLKKRIPHNDIADFFSGYKLPVRLVKVK